MYIHTCVRNAVMLVWGSLRLITIRLLLKASSMKLLLGMHVYCLISKMETERRVQTTTHLGQTPTVYATADSYNGLFILH